MYQMYDGGEGNKGLVEDLSHNARLLSQKKKLRPVVYKILNNENKPENIIEEDWRLCMTSAENVIRHGNLSLRIASRGLEKQPMIFEALIKMRASIQRILTPKHFEIIDTTLQIAIDESPLKKLVWEKEEVEFIMQLFCLRYNNRAQ